MTNTNIQFQVKVDENQDWDNPMYLAHCPNQQDAMNFIGSIKQDWGMAPDENNDWFLVVRLSDGKTCHPRMKKETVSETAQRWHDHVVKKYA